ncbi:MAG: hypothetical protein HAW67_04935, partial [Endozoicomonadaceae bacterium]|nr:hypothetical protein [Endozoicomonadaceae bacterium]
MIEQIQHILSTKGEEFSALLEILSKQESVKLKKYFDHEDDNQIDLSDAEIKFYASNALFIYIKNHPLIEKELQAKEISTKNFAVKIYELSNLLHHKKNDWESYFYASAYAVLADKATLLGDIKQPKNSEDMLSRLAKIC